MICMHILGHEHHRRSRCWSTPNIQASQQTCTRRSASLPVLVGGRCWPAVPAAAGTSRRAPRRAKQTCWAVRFGLAPAAVKEQQETVCRQGGRGPACLGLTPQVKVPNIAAVPGPVGVFFRRVMRLSKVHYGSGCVQLPKQPVAESQAAPSIWAFWACSCELCGQALSHICSIRSQAPRCVQMCRKPVCRFGAVCPAADKLCCPAR